MRKPPAKQGSCHLLNFTPITPTKKSAMTSTSKMPLLSTHSPTLQFNMDAAAEIPISHPPVLARKTEQKE